MKYFRCAGLVGIALFVGCAAPTESPSPDPGEIATGTPTPSSPTKHTFDPADPNAYELLKTPESIAAPETVVFLQTIVRKNPDGSLETIRTPVTLAQQIAAHKLTVSQPNSIPAQDSIPAQNTMGVSWSCSSETSPHFRS